MLPTLPDLEVQVISGSAASLIVQTSAGKSKMVLFPNSQVVFKAQLVQGKGTLSGRQLYALCGTHYFL